MEQEQLKPYSVTKGRAYTDWWAELTLLQQLKDKGQENWTDEEKTKVHHLNRLAASWVTCACGNQCSIIPRFGSEGGPVDPTLHTLGAKFYQDVSNINIEAAALTLERIEKRSEVLIKDILKDQMQGTA